MRRWSLPGILFLSIAANVVLWLKVNREEPQAATAHGSDSPVTIIVTNRRALPEQQRLTKVAWQDLDDPSIPNFIANLRAVKCPEPTIRDIVTARLDEQLDERIASIPGPAEFWSTVLQKDRVQQEQREKSRVLEREEEGLVQELFGVDWNRDAYLSWVLDPYDEFSLGFLPREKAMSVEYDLQNLARAVETAFKGRDIAPKSDNRELERLSQQLKSKLSPTEYAELNLRSLVVMAHYDGFPDVPLSGGDVRYIVSLYAKHLDFIDNYLRGPQKFDELKKSAEVAAQEDIRNYLGADRYAAFERAEDYGYQTLHRAAHDAGRSPDTAKRIFDMKPEASRRAMTILQNGSLAPDARAKQLSDLRGAYRAAVTKLLGEDGIKDYESHYYKPWWNHLGEVVDGGGAP